MGFLRDIAKRYHISELNRKFEEREYFSLSLCRYDFWHPVSIVKKRSCPFIGVFAAHRAKGGISTSVELSPEEAVWISYSTDRFIVHDLVQSCEKKPESSSE